MRASGSSSSAGTSNRAGTNALPAVSLACSSRMLMGMPMRSAESEMPCASW